MMKSTGAEKIQGDEVSTSQNSTTKVAPPGYKQTKVGVIPEDWDVVKIGELCNCIVPGRNKPVDFIGNIPWVTTPDLDSKYIFDTKSNLYVNKDEAKKIGSKIVPENSVIMTCVGEFGIISIVKDEIIINQQLHAFLPSKLIETEFLYYALSSQRKYMERIATKTAVPYMNKNNCNSIPLPLPHLKEQQKIAQILTTWDDAISKQEAFIKAKEELKKGLMQKLLSGEVRFNGFDGEWEEVRLGDKFDFIKTYSNSRSHLSDVGDMEYMHYGDIHTKYKFHIDLSKVILPKISESNIKGTIEYVKNGDLIIADASEDYADIGKSVEVVNLQDKKVISGLHTFLLRDNDNNFSNGYKGLMLYNQKVAKEIKKIATGISVLGISKTNLSKLYISLPPKQEQQKIAEVLTLADKDIELLKNELEALKEQKRGLMQKLLSGEVRVGV